MSSDSGILCRNSAALGSCTSTVKAMAGVRWRRCSRFRVGGIGDGGLLIKWRQREQIRLSWGNPPRRPANPQPATPPPVRGRPASVLSRPTPAWSASPCPASEADPALAPPGPPRPCLGAQLPTCQASPCSPRSASASLERPFRGISDCRGALACKEEAAPLGRSSAGRLPIASGFAFNAKLLFVSTLPTRAVIVEPSVDMATA